MPFWNDSMLMAASGGPPEHVGSNTAGFNTVSIPTHQAGDLIIGRGTRTSNSAYATLPGGWTEIDRGIFDGPSTSDVTAVWAYQFATTNSTTFGTWTNAAATSVYVIRNVLGIGNHGIRENRTAVLDPGDQMISPLTTLLEPNKSYVLALSVSSWAGALPAMTSLSGAYPTGQQITLAPMSSYVARSTPVSATSFDLSISVELLV